jgi:hypothetical protein
MRLVSSFIEKPDALSLIIWQRRFGRFGANGFSEHLAGWKRKLET